jgi:hypothetical protein
VAEGAEAAPAAGQGKKGGAPRKPEPRGFGTLGDLLAKKAPKR